MDLQQTQCVDKVVDVPLAMPRQTPVIQGVQMRAEIPQNQFIDREVDVLVMGTRQVPLIVGSSEDGCGSKVFHPTSVAPLLCSRCVTPYAGDS